MQNQLDLADSERKLVTDEAANRQQKEEMNQQQIQELKAALEVAQGKLKTVGDSATKLAETEKEVGQLKAQIVTSEAQQKEALSQKEAERQQLEKEHGKKVCFFFFWIPNEPTQSQTKTNELAKTKEALQTAVNELKNTEKMHHDQVAQLQKAAKEREKCRVFDCFVESGSSMFYSNHFICFFLHSSFAQFSGRILTKPRRLPRKTVTPSARS